MTSNVKSSLLNIDNLAQPVHMQLSNEQKSIFQFFSTSLKSRANFEHLWEKDDAHRLCIAEIKDCQRRG